jgi:UDP-glucuronate decarboxylase
MKKKTIIVAGGAGFLGSHLCERLLQDGHTVYCVDNLCTGSRDNIAAFFPNPAFRFIEHDVCFPFDIPADEIYNLACPASPMSYQANPIQTAKTNLFGAINLLELAVRYRSKIFQASTSEVYGDPQEHPQREEYWGHVNPIGIRSCYDEGKRCAETFFYDYWRVHNVPIKIGRIFNTYGPRMQPNDGRVISNLIVQALKDKPLTIYGDGTQTRSFCYVDDLIEGMIRLMNGPPDIIGPLNIGNPSELRIIDLAREVIALTGSKSKIIFLPLPSDDPRQRCPDIAKMREGFDWIPGVPLKEGLGLTIQYFIAHLPSAPAIS